MAKARTLVGLDVHATKIVAAVLDAETGELQCFRLGGGVGEAAALCAGLPRPVRAAYEAGPTGYGLARELGRRGVGCVVAAPGKIPRAATDRIKTDRRDAEHLVRLLWAGKLHAVRVPGPEEEALRDLVRAREAVRQDPMRCRHRLSKLLLRHGIRFDDGPAWGERHRAWLAGITLSQPAAQATLSDAIGAVDALCHRRERLEREILALLPGSPWEAQVGLLRCLRAMDTLTAVGLCGEIGDFERFARAEQLMSYLGLVPSESSTGEQRRLGAITKTGSTHARRLLVEAAWHHRPRPRIGRGLQQRQDGQPAEAIAIAWSAAAPAPHLAAAGGTRQAPHHHRRRRGPRTRRLLLGHRPRRVTHHHQPVGSVGGGPAAHESIRDCAMSTRPAAGHARCQTAEPHDEQRSCGQPDPRISA